VAATFVPQFAQNRAPSFNFVPQFEQNMVIISFPFSFSFSFRNYSAVALWSLRGALPVLFAVASGSPEAIHPLTGGAYVIRIASLRSQVAAVSRKCQHG
jgi:hypothetical protein